MVYYKSYNLSRSGEEGVDRTSLGSGTCPLPIFRFIFSRRAQAAAAFATADGGRHFQCRPKLLKGII